MSPYPIFDTPGFDAIIPAWQAKLQAEYPAACELVNTAVDDDWLAQPGLVLPYPPIPSTVNVFPTTGMMLVSDTAEDDVGHEWTGVYTIGFVVFTQHAEPEGLAATTRRQVRALKTAALANRRLPMPEHPNMTTGRLTYAGTTWGPAFADLPDSEAPPSAYFTWSIVRLVSRHDEG